MIKKFLNKVRAKVMSNQSNYNIAKTEADKIDERIIEVLNEGTNFRVEAGAGSGKTYSLNKVIEWIQANKINNFKRNNQNVVCITYTNAAVDVIAERLSKDSCIIPSTIHSFAWGAIKQFQSKLIEIIDANESLQPKEGDFFPVKEVQYTMGHRYKEKGIQYLYHDDVLFLFCELLDMPKYQRFFSQKYPLILIDEYQDSYKPIIDRFINYFISTKTGPQFGFFGDAWQTIYQSSKACGAIEHDNIKTINKTSNFRSAPRIVEFLNSLRPDLPQYSAIDDFEGEVIAVTCDDYSGERRTERNFKGDLPINELRDRITRLKEEIKNISMSDESIKVLMITHKVLALQQGYEKLLDIINEGIRDKEDCFLLFFMNVVEPIYKALCDNNTQLLFDTLIKRYPITKKSEKKQWCDLRIKIDTSRNKKAIDVLDDIIKSNLIPIPPQVKAYYDFYYNTPDLMYKGNTNIKDFLELDYNQFLSAIHFLYPEAEFSTEHGVKGEEYDNIIFVIGKGWNQYQFEVYAPMITGMKPIPEDKLDSYKRNRNLFYVCCSRPKKRLILFLTIQTDPTFKSFLEKLIGTENIYTYTDYLKKQNKT